MSAGVALQGLREEGSAMTDRKVSRASAVSMDTLVTIEVVCEHDASAAIAEALRWFETVEATCSRFDPESELSRLSAKVGEPVVVSPLLFRAVQFALAVAAASDGAFDPTIGQTLIAKGFNRNYRSGETVEASKAARKARFSDVVVDPSRLTVTQQRPLTLDLGAVAKGMAIDLAAETLRPFRDFAINAGGDLYFGGTDGVHAGWLAGIRNPGDPEAVLETLLVSDRAVCSSGDYERRSEDGGHHIVDPGSGESASSVSGATVVGPGAMVADALATAAFVLGPRRGLALLERQGVDGMMVTRDGKRFETAGYRRNVS